jgi:hypothetical protein
LDVAFALLAENADWTDRLAAVAGVSEPPRARERLDEQLSYVDDVIVEETNVVDLAAFVARVNGSM